MEPVKMCRICVTTEDIRMYPYNILSSYYKDFLNLTVTDNESILPQFVCYECSALLMKCYNFKEKCLRSLKLILECVDNGRVNSSQVLSNRTISETDRDVNNLKSNVQFWRQSKRVKVLEMQYDDTSLGFDYSKFVHNDVLDIEQKEPLEVKIEYPNDSDIDLNNELDKSVDPLPYKNPVKIEDSKIKKEILIEPLHSEPKSSDVSKLKINKRKAKQDTSKTKKSRIPAKKSVPKKIVKEKKNTVIDENKWRVVIFTEEQALTKFNDRRNGFWYKTAPYKCDMCYKGFSTESSFKNHQRVHDSKISGILECKFCKINMNYGSKLSCHVKTHYEEYHCLKCEYVGTSWISARYHEDVHYGKGYTCETCDEKFSHSSTYYSHLRVAHRSQHICSECGESFVTPNGVTMHRAKVHGIYTKKKTKVSQEMAVLEKELERKGERYCRECDVNFTSDAAYDKHFLSAENHAAIFSDSKCDSQEKPQEESKPLKDYRPTKTQLKVWRIARLRANSMKEETTKVKRRKTWARKKREKSTHCKECGKFFLTVAECSLHHNAEHPKKPFYSMRRVICEICGKDVQHGQYNIHMNQHTKKTKYECERCSKVFYYKATLQRHMLTHTGEKPHQCSMCEKRYTQPGSLQLHVRTAHHRLPYPPRSRRPKPSPLVGPFYAPQE